MSANIELITGPMGARKTSHAIFRAEDLTREGKSVLIVKHSNDDRYTTSEELQAHNGLKHSCTTVYVTYLGSVGITNYNVVIIDEAQTFPDLAVMCYTWRANNIDVYAYGLKTNFEGVIFPPIINLMAIADRCIELTAKCHCGRAATFTSKKEEFIEGDSLAFVPGKIGEMYNPVCSAHFGFTGFLAANGSTITSNTTNAVGTVVDKQVSNVVDTVVDKPVSNVFGNKVITIKQRAKVSATSSSGSGNTTTAITTVKQRVDEYDKLISDKIKKGCNDAIITSLINKFCELEESQRKELITCAEIAATQDVKLTGVCFTVLGLRSNPQLFATLFPILKKYTIIHNKATDSYVVRSPVAVTKNSISSNDIANALAMKQSYASIIVQAEEKKLSWFERSEADN
jgi:thymidine kinase